MGTDVCTFPPEELLLFLCAHGAKHGWRRLEWICGVAELLRVRPQLDWDQVFKLAEQLGSRRMLFVGLSLATNLLGATLPRAVGQSVKADRVGTRLAERVSETLFHAPEGNRGLLDTPIPIVGLSPRLIGFHLQAKERLRDKVQYGLEIARHMAHDVLTPNRKDEELLPLPASLTFLHYLLRPFRLLRDFAFGT
jgi:hypothetical protein